MKNINESGRSMVEMLGVLAIIGVLSIGGIAGYTMAMNKYTANQIVETVVQAAIACRTSGNIPADLEHDNIDTISCVNRTTGEVSWTYKTGNNAPASGVTTQVNKTVGTTNSHYTPES